MQLRAFLFYFYFLEQPDDDYILAETCSWLFFINVSSVRTDYGKRLVIFQQVNTTIHLCKWQTIHCTEI